MTRDRGASIIEYGAVILLVAALATVVLSSGVPDQVRNLYMSALCEIGAGTMEECGEDPGGDPVDTTAPGESDPAPGETEKVPLESEERIPTTDSAWPNQVSPALFTGEHAAEYESVSDTGGVLSEEESPLYEDPGPYPQRDEVERSNAGYRSLGQGEELPCWEWEDMCCPENTCETLYKIENSIDYSRLACRIVGEDWAYCRPNAADFLQHFIEGSGEDVDPDLDAFINDVPEFQKEIEKRQQNFIDDALSEAESRDIDEPLTIPISTEKQDWGYPPENVNGRDFVYDDPDWSNAIGSFHYWMEGEITVHPPSSPDEEYSYELETNVEMEKFYNWERDNTDPLFTGWKQKLADYSQADIAKLHQYGMAQEFWIRGGAELPAVEG